MRIARLEVIWLKVPLVTPFQTSFGTAHDKDTFLVRLRRPTAPSAGRSAPRSWTRSTARKWLDGCEQVLRRELVPRASSPSVTSSPRAASRPPRAGDGQLRGKHVIETAVLDAELKEAGWSFGHHLGAVKERVPAGVSVGIMDSIPAARPCRALPGPGLPADQASRSSRAGTSQLCVPSANASGTRSRSRSTPMLPTPPADAGPARLPRPFDLLLIEQPLPTDDIPQPCSPRHLDQHAGLPRRVDRVGARRRDRDRPRRLPGHQHQKWRESAAATWRPAASTTSRSPTAYPCGVAACSDRRRRAPNVALLPPWPSVLPGDTSASGPLLPPGHPQRLRARSGARGRPHRPGHRRRVLPDALAEVSISRSDVGLTG